MQTATQFLARYMPPASATEQCYYCAGRCGREYAAADYVKPSFTARDTVAATQYICPGCVKSLDESATIEMLDGEIRKGQKTRCYSWFRTQDWVRAASKTHRADIAAILLSPPHRNRIDKHCSACYDATKPHLQPRQGPAE